MENKPKEIIDMKAETTAEGEVRYTQNRSPRLRRPWPPLLTQMVGVAIGVAIFIGLLFFFVYVIIPLIVILILWAFLRGLFVRR